MKKTLAILFTILWINHSFCQDPRLIYIDKYKILDTVRYEIIYEVTVQNNPNNKTFKENDIHKLLIGYNLSKTFSYLNFQNDSISNILIKQNKDYPSTPAGVHTYEIFKKYNTKTVNFITIDDVEVFWYDEAIPQINWKIQNEKKNIAGYSCQKASGKFRGRDYEAWFTYAIPISEGPYKFTGLPGLILEIYDTQNQYHFTCTNIKSPKSLELITIRDWKYITKTTYEKYNALRKSYAADPVGYYKTKGIDLMIMENNKIKSPPQGYSIPYNPIELE